jgi:hypothetical protein
MLQLLLRLLLTPKLLNLYYFKSITHPYQEQLHHHNTTKPIPYHISPHITITTIKMSSTQTIIKAIEATSRRSLLCLLLRKARPPAACNPLPSARLLSWLMGGAISRPLSRPTTRPPSRTDKQRPPLSLPLGKSSTPSQRCTRTRSSEHRCSVGERTRVFVRMSLPAWGPLCLERFYLVARLQCLTSSIAANFIR